MRSEEEFEIELSGLDHDMTAALNFITAKYKDQPERCPELVIVSCLPDGKKILPLADKKGVTRVLLAAEATNMEIVSAVYEELENPSEAKPLPEDSTFYYSQNDIFELYGVMMTISNVLKIRCPQLIYTANMPFEGGNVAALQNAVHRTNVIVLKQNENLTNAMRHLAYSLRQAWQHEKHQDLYYAGYKRPGENPTDQEIHDYMMQKAEIDAEAFSLRFMGYMLGGTAKPNKSYADVNDAIQARADKLAVPF